MGNILPIRGYHTHLTLNGWSFNCCSRGRERLCVTPNINLGLLDFENERLRERRGRGEREREKAELTTVSGQFMGPLHRSSLPRPRLASPPLGITSAPLARSHSFPSSSFVEQKSRRN